MRLKGERLMMPNTVGLILLFSVVFFASILWATRAKGSRVPPDLIQGSPRPLVARKELSEFLVTATAGAFLVGLAGTVPIDLGFWIDPAFKRTSPDGLRQPWLVLILKYGYATWLTVYSSCPRSASSMPS